MQGHRRPHAVSSRRCHCAAPPCASPRLLRWSQEFCMVRLLVAGHMQLAGGPATHCHSLCSAARSDAPSWLRWGLRAAPAGAAPPDHAPRSRRTAGASIPALQTCSRSPLKECSRQHFVSALHSRPHSGPAACQHKGALCPALQWTSRDLSGGLQEGSALYHKLSLSLQPASGSRCCA